MMLQRKRSRGALQLSNEDLVEMMEFADVRTKYRKKKAKRFPFLAEAHSLLFSVCLLIDENDTRTL